jgi:nicotinate-nucleotide adenylyltransferase
VSQPPPAESPVLLPVPAGAEPVLLYGGVFDPPHQAHIELPLRVRDLVPGPEAWLVFVPAAKSPLKPGGPAAPDEDRLAMLRLALGTEAPPRVAIWTDEIDRASAAGAPSYWIDTVERASQGRTPGRLFFLIGADQAADFHLWREYRRILSLARPLVMLRSPIDSPAALQEALRRARGPDGQPVWAEDDIRRWLQAVVPVALRDDRSTLVRELLARRDDSVALTQLAAMLHPSVIEYIRQRPHLYAAPRPPSSS